MNSGEQGAPCQWPIGTDADRWCGRPSVGWAEAEWPDGESPVSSLIPVCREHLDARVYDLERPDPSSP
jgi:hypothetical protein